eukprot:133070-Rhodomonas_salina.4
MRHQFSSEDRNVPVPMGIPQIPPAARHSTACAEARPNKSVSRPTAGAGFQNEKDPDTQQEGI